MSPASRPPTAIAIARSGGLIARPYSRHVERARPQMQAGVGATNHVARILIAPLQPMPGNCTGGRSGRPQIKAGAGAGNLAARNPSNLPSGATLSAAPANVER